MQLFYIARSSELNYHKSISQQFISLLCSISFRSKGSSHFVLRTWRVSLCALTICAIATTFKRNQSDRSLSVPFLSAAFHYPCEIESADQLPVSVRSALSSRSWKWKESFPWPRGWLSLLSPGKSASDLFDSLRKQKMHFTVSRFHACVRVNTHMWRKRASPIPSFRRRGSLSTRFSFHSFLQFNQLGSCGIFASFSCMLHSTLERFCCCAICSNSPRLSS